MSRLVHSCVGGTIYPDVAELVFAGRGFALCGRMITSAVLEELASSTDEVERVTCFTCQVRLLAIHKAYARARRAKKVDW